MGRLKRQYMRTSRMVIARTSAYTGIDGPAMRGGCDGEGTEPYRPLRTAAAGCALLKFFAVYVGITSSMSLLKMTARSGNASGDVSVTCAEFALNIHTDVGVGVGGVVGAAMYAWTYLDNHSVLGLNAWAFGVMAHVWTHGEAQLGNAMVAAVYAKLDIAEAADAGSVPDVSVGVFVANIGAEIPTTAIRVDGIWEYFAYFTHAGAMWDGFTDVVTGGTAAGFLRVLTPSGARYIPLYS